MGTLRVRCQGPIMQCVVYKVRCQGEMSGSDIEGEMSGSDNAVCGVLVE
jgi:hypothetical protein